MPARQEVFCMSEKVIMSAEDMRRAWTRIAHEVIERNHGCDFSQLPRNDDHLYRDPDYPWDAYLQS